MSVKHIVIRLVWLVSLVASSVALLTSVTMVSCIDNEEASTAATFRTKNLIVEESSDLGDVTHSTDINGPTRQSVNITDPAYAFGELNLMTVTGIVPAWPADLFMQVWRSDNDADCTTHDQHSGGLAVQVSGSRSAGANALVNTAIECTAENAQSNYCLHVLKGDFVFDGGGQILQNSGDAFFAGNYLATGPTTPLIAEGAGVYAIYISANPGPTSSIYSGAPDPSWNAHNVTGSVLKLWNDTADFFLNVSGPVRGFLMSPNGLTSLSAGTFGTGSTETAGNITGVGATSTTMTFNTLTFARSWCFAQPEGAAPQDITVTRSATAPVFSCFDTTTGLAANCVDFSYWCVMQ